MNTGRVARRIAPTCRRVSAPTTPGLSLRLHPARAPATQHLARAAHRRAIPPLRHHTSTPKRRFSAPNNAATTTAAGPKTVTYTVVTVIRPPDAQAGVKSQQTVRIDPVTGKLVSNTYSTGVTHAGLTLPSIRDNFTATSSPTPAGYKVNLSGETASAVQILPNINYDVQIYYNRSTDTVTLRGAHDGYPSYEIYQGNTQIYDYQQGFLGQLAGDSDVSIKKDWHP